MNTIVETFKAVGWKECKLSEVPPGEYAFNPTTLNGYHPDMVKAMTIKNPHMVVLCKNPILSNPYGEGTVAKVTTIDGMNFLAIMDDGNYWHGVDSHIRWNDDDVFKTQVLMGEDGWPETWVVADTIENLFHTEGFDGLKECMRRRGLDITVESV